MVFTLSGIILAVGRFYGYVLIAYVLLSWLPDNGVIHDIRRVLGSVVEPYLSMFRRIIPPIGAIDISPIVAYLVLIVAVQIIATLVARTGL